MTRFTIITCTYNAGDVIEPTLRSVYEQTHTAVEHLIIDGQSTDKTISKAQEYQQRNDAYGKGHEVVIKSESDRGLYDAMNKGLRMATGDYVLFLNAGDILFSTHTLADIDNLIADSNPLPAVLYGDTVIIDSEGVVVGHRRFRPPTTLSWRSFRQGMVVCHQAFFARTDLARQCPYDLQYRFSADVDWCIRIMRLAEQRNLALLNLNMETAGYLEGGMSIKNHRASLKERFLVMQKHYGRWTTLRMHAWFVVRALIYRKGTRI